MHRRVRFSHAKPRGFRPFVQDFLLYLGAVIAILLISLAVSLYLNSPAVILTACAIAPCTIPVFLVFTLLFPRKVTESFYDT